MLVQATLFYSLSVEESVALVVPRYLEVSAEQKGVQSELIPEWLSGILKPLSRSM